MSRSFDASRWAELSPQLDELLELDAAAREARIAQLRERDSALADALATLLAGQAAVESEGFLEGRVLDATPTPEATLAGRRIGAYTLEHPLGAGGMGSVWRARRSDGRYEASVAVKLLNLALLGRGGGERFAREGQLLARLAHQNIARLLDAGVEDGQPYLVLEHVDGEPIDHWCDANELGTDARVRLMLDVLAAVAHAHSNLVLHRDLKPSNILVTRDGSVKLLDFGIAKLLDGQALPAPATELTQIAGRAFTPDYAAPEQVQGGDVTTATDVYALGVLLYVLLTGVHPTAIAGATPIERLRSVVDTDPPRLSDAVARNDTAATRRAETTLPRLASTLRGDLDNIAAKALKKAPRERYATAAELANDLRRYLANEPVTARPDTFGYRAAKFVRRHRWAIAAASTTFLVLVAGVIGTAWQAIEARRERDEALHQAERANARTGFFQLVLGAIGDPDRPVTHRDILDRSVALVDKQFANDPRIAIDLLYPIAGQYGSIGDADKDVAVMRRAAAFAAATGDPQLIGHVACNTVPAELGRGRVELARAQMQAAQAAMQRVANPTFQSVIECMRSEAELALAEGDLERALKRNAEAIARCERTGNTKGNLYTSLLGLQASLLEQHGELAASFEVAQRLVRLYERSGLADSLNYMATRRREAAILMAWGEYRDAQAIIDTIAPRLRDLGSDAARPPWLDTIRGQLLLRFGDLPAAAAALQAAAERAQTRGSARHAMLARFNLARVLIEQHRLGEAERLLNELEAVPQSGLGHATPATVRAALQLAQGATASARSILDVELQRLGDGDSVARAAALRMAARAHAAAGETPRAVQIGRDAVAAAERVARDPQRSADVGEALLLLAQAQRAAGAGTDAAASAERAAVALSSGLGDAHSLTREARALAVR